MQALWMKSGDSRLRDVPRPEPVTGEALVQVRMAGVCATDLQLLKGYYPFVGVPGHEFVGEVTACESAPERVGQRVVGEINLRCGQCRECLSGNTNHCLQRETLGIHKRNGAFAEYLCLPLENLYPVPDRVPDRAAVFAEPLAAALQITRQNPLRPDERVLVVGAGRLGQLIARVLRLSGCDLQVVARYPRQRDLLEQVGIRWVDEAALPERYFDRVVEASGSPGGFALARNSLRPGGLLVLKSTFKGELNLNLSSLVVDEIRLQGSRCGPFAPALRLLEQGLVDPLPLIDEVLPLDRAEDALSRAAESAVMKVLIDCGV